MFNQSTKKLNIFLVAVLTVLFIVPLLSISQANAAFNQKINYQGKLLDSTNSPVADGTYSIVFRIYTVPTGGSNIWTETQNVSVMSGLFSVMLGSSTALSGVDFNQTLYLGINVEADGEMSPRKVIGAVPAAFEAKNAQTLDNIATTSFLRSDQADDIAATTASTLLTITQSGAGDILNLFDGASEVFTVVDGGGVGIGTTTPDHELVVNGDFQLTGGIFDNSASSGLAGYVLQSTNGGIQWVATSTLGLSSPFGVSIDPTELTATDFGDFSCNGTTCSLDSGVVAASELASGIPVSTFTNDANYLTDITTQLFTDLSDTPAVYAANEVLYMTGSAVTSSTTFQYTGSQLQLGGTGLSMTGSTANIALGSNYLSGDGDDEGIQLDTAGRVRVQTTNGSESSLWLRNTASNDGSSMSVVFEGGAGVDVSKIQSVLRGGTDDTDLRFFNNQSNALVEMLRLSYNGEILMGTTTASGAFLAVQTTGTKDILNLYETGGQKVFTVLESGNVGVGTSTPSQALTVAGGFRLSGAFRDQNNSAGTNGYVLQTNGSGTQWVATSTLGFSSSFSNSAQLASLLSDETGSAGGGVAVFSVSPTLTGTPVLPSTFTMGANSFIRSGAHDLTLTTTGTTNVTLPLTGTLATLAGTETFSNKTISSPTLTGTVSGGTFSGGTWNGSVIGSSYGGAGTINGLLKANGSGVVSAATAGTDYENALTFSNGLTRTSNAIALGGSLTSNTTISEGNSFNTTITSSLSGGARSTGVLIISQANDATNNSTAPLLNLSNSDTGSSNTVLSITQASTGGNGITISSLTGGTSFTVANTTGTAINADTLTSGTGLTAATLTTGAAVVAGLGDSASTGSALRVTNSAGMSVDYTGAIIDVSPIRTLGSAATRNNTGNYLRIQRTNVTNNASANLTVSGDLVKLISNCTQTLGTCTDSSNILSLTQSYAAASGAILNIAGAGSGNLATLDATNASANGVSIDVQSNSSSQYAFSVTSNNAATNGLYVRADGQVGIGNAAPTQALHVTGGARITGALYDNANSAGTSGYVLKSTGTGFNWVATSTLGLGGSGGTVSSVALAAPTGFSVSGSPVTTTGTLTLSYAAGYEGLRTASSTNWNTFYNTPSNRITAGTGLTWSGNTINLDNDFGVSIDESELNIAGSPTNGYVLQASSTSAGGFVWVATSTLGITGGSSFSDSAGLAALLSDETGTGRSVFSISPAFSGTATFSALTASSTLTLSGSTANIALGSNYLSGDGDDEGINITSTGNVGIGTTTQQSILGLQKLSVTGAATAGIDRYYGLANGTLNAVQYGDKAYIKTTNTATTTIVGSMIKLEDSTTYGNTVRGLEVQAHRGTNTLGENTALSGFARTFGVRGTTEGDAGALFEPAGIFGQTKGTTQGNAMRAYSASITTADLVSLFQDTSAFTGTGLVMNFGNSGGSFSSTSSKFVDFQNAGTSKFTITAQGTTTIGDGTTNNMAGLQIGYGGLCVDNDGSCTASVKGRIASVSTYAGNSDLAEMYFSSQNLEPGEVVISDGFLSVKRATGAKGEQVLGVVSTKPGLLLGFDDNSLIPGQQGYPLALSGRVPVQLSDENGSIAIGDPLTLSSLPGVAMKASSSTEIIGYALESYDGTHAYTLGFVDQFGDDIARPNFEAISVNTDTRINDGCSFGAGGATGEVDEDCLPKVITQQPSSEDQATAAEAKYQAEQAALNALKNKSASKKMLADGRKINVGQIIMFVDRGYHFNDSTLSMLDELTSTSSVIVLGSREGSGDTLWNRLKNLAQNFVDGVLTLAGVDVNKVQTKVLCVDDVCVTSSDLRALLNAQHSTVTNSSTQTTITNPGTTTIISGPSNDVSTTTTSFTSTSNTSVSTSETTSTTTSVVTPEEIVTQDETIPEPIVEEVPLVVIPPTEVEPIDAPGILPVTEPTPTSS